MAKVTSKLQVTIPKAIAEQYGIKPGSELDWVPAGEAIRVVPARPGARADEVELRLKQFDQTTARLKKQQKAFKRRAGVGDRGWKREDLYRRGRAR